MRWGWVLMGAAALVACGTTEIPTSATEGAGAGDVGAPTGGGAAGAGGGGSPAAEEQCVATCCDGSTVVGTSADAVACELDHGLACAAAGGPVAVVYGGEIAWQAEGACPTMLPCSVNCCSGVKEPQGEHFDADLCAVAGKEGSHCAGQGGIAKIFLGKQSAFQDMTCSGPCQTNCCDGSIAFSEALTPIDCEMWAGRMCLSAEGGPGVVAYGGTMVWTAGGQCPSLKSCTLTCTDGESQSGMAYQEKVCIGDSISGTFCADHDGPASIAFDGLLVWQAP